MAPVYKVVITPKAEARLEKIVLYLLDNASLKKAENTRVRIMNAIYNLAKMPDSNSPAKDLNTGKNFYRRVLVKPYRIVFTIREDQLQVVVVSIHHIKENPEKIKGTLQ